MVLICFIRKCEKCKKKCKKSVKYWKMQKCKKSVRKC